MSRRKKSDWISQKDWDDLDIPEATEEDFHRAKTMDEVAPEFMAAWRARGAKGVTRTVRSKTEHDVKPNSV